MRIPKRIYIAVVFILFFSVCPSLGQTVAEKQWIKGIGFGANGNFKEAKEEFEKVPKYPNTFPIIINNTAIFHVIFRARSRYDHWYDELAERALKLIDDVKVKKLNSTAAIHIFKGIDYAFKGQTGPFKRPTELAIIEFNKAIELAPTYAYAYYWRGNAYYNKGQCDQAIADYSKAIDLNSRDVKAYNNRGYAFGDKGQYDQSIANYTKALFISVLNVEVNAKLRFAYAKNGQLEQADKIPKSIFNDRTTLVKLVEVYCNRGSAYFKKGQYDQAIADYTNAIEINPARVDWEPFPAPHQIQPIEDKRLAKAYYNRGLAQEAKGNMKMACSDWEKACEFGNCSNWGIKTKIRCFLK